MMMKLAQLLKLHEDIRLTVYDDATGKPIKQGSTLVGHPTIGIGRNLAGKGLSIAEAEFLLNNDIIETSAELARRVPNWNTLDVVRKAVLTDMCFNMGLTKFLTFKRFLKAVADHDWGDAELEMANSLWARQVGTRAIRLGVMMLKGEWPEEIK